MGLGLGFGLGLGLELGLGLRASTLRFSRNVSDATRKMWYDAMSLALRLPCRANSSTYSQQQQRLTPGSMWVRCGLAVG